MRILFILMSLSLLSFNAIVESNKVHATVYNAVPEQTNSDPGHTAFMFELDLNDPFKHKIIAVSRDLLVKYPKGTKVYVCGTSYDGRDYEALLDHTRTRSFRGHSARACQITLMVRGLPRHMPSASSI